SPEIGRVALFWSRNKPPPVTLPPKAFNALETFRDRFTLAGSIALDRCPVCGGGEIGLLWQLPQTRLGAATYLNSPGSPYHDYYLDSLPMLRVPQQVYAFDICRACHSVFRNPMDDDHAAYVKDTSKVASFKASGTAGFAGVVDSCERHLPKDTSTVVD